MEPLNGRPGFSGHFAPVHGLLAFLHVQISEAVDERRFDGFLVHLEVSARLCCSRATAQLCVKMYRSSGRCGKRDSMKQSVLFYSLCVL